MQTVIDVLEQITTEAVRKASPKPVAYGTLAPGDCHRQGDVYISCLNNIPKQTQPITNPSLQIAPGDTQGSRHTLDSFEGIEMFTLIKATPLDGPLLRTSRHVTIGHPEHGHVVLPPGCYAVTYQRQLAEEIKRIQD